MARPRTAAEPLITATMRQDRDDWADLTALYGDQGRAVIVRQLIAHHLRRGPAAPPRPDAGELGRIAAARRAASAGAA